MISLWFPTAVESYKKTPVLDIHHEITILSSEYGIDPKLVVAIIKCESNFKEDARNYDAVVGVDIGIAQINSYWHEERMKKLGMDIYNTTDNLEYGIMLMSENLNHYKWSMPCWNK